MPSTHLDESKALEDRSFLGVVMEPLTDKDRMRLIAAMGLLVLTAREIDSESLGLLLKLSDPDTRLWVQKEAVDRELLSKLNLDFAAAK